MSGVVEFIVNPMLGKLMDKYGRKWVYYIGPIVSGVMSALRGGRSKKAASASVGSTEKRLLNFEERAAAAEKKLAEFEESAARARECMRETEQAALTAQAAWLSDFGSLTQSCPGQLLSGPDTSWRFVPAKVLHSAAKSWPGTAWY